MTILTSSGYVTVVLNSDTQVEDDQSVFHARKRQMGVTALVPGLSVQVKGSYNGQNQLVAEPVKFNGKAPQTATDIQAGMAPVQEQQQQQQIAQQQAQIQATQAEQAKHEQEIEQEKAAVAAVNKRFGQSGEYNLWDDAEVLFANGQAKVDSQAVGTVPEGQDGERLCDTGAGICFQGRFSGVEPEAEPGAGTQRH